MPSHRPFDPRLLGGLSPATFFARHWQREPLLIRGALDVPADLPRRDALFALASRDDVESRLIRMPDARRDEWTLAHGPFERLPRTQRDWTLLVQGVNLVDDAADALMRRFDFASTIRLDDCMMSYAVDGGGVGPHVDSYDVFLLQVEGRRRWRWRRGRKDRDLPIVDGSPLKRLASFAPDDDAMLDAGDMLYLPPGCAHEGVAVGPCITASIGFRAPAWQELLREFLFDAGERIDDEGLLEDPDRRASRAPSAIDDAFVISVEDRIARLRWTRSDIVDFIGRSMTTPKAHVFFDAPTPRPRASFVRDASRGGLALDRRATLLYRGRAAFIAGERFDIAAGHRGAIVELADRRRLGARSSARALSEATLAALMHGWWEHGWMHVEGELHDDRP